MDRKGKQKISLAGLFLCVILLIVMFFGGNMAHERHIRDLQKKEISVIYPEIAEELQENIIYYEKQTMGDDILTMAAILVVVIGFGTAVSLWGSRKSSSQKRENEAEWKYIYERLLRFQNGNEEALSFQGETDSQSFEDVCEKLNDLLHYITAIKSRLQEEENSTKALITDISHQLKTPLASIRMSHELAESTDLSEEERRSFMDSETKEILKMEELLDELVKLSRLENSMIQIKAEPGSVKNTICEAVSRIYLKAGARNIEICVDMEEDVNVPHDHKWTVEALANIIENAVKYSKPETSVHIAVELLASNVLIQIEDEGIGIPEGEVNAIFKRFYRGSNAKEIAKEGAGVGLYLARSIIEQQGGTIVAKRKSKNGTIFKITLPL